MTNKTRSIAVVEQIDIRILPIRGHRVMVDADLAEIYGGAAKAIPEDILGRASGRFGRRVQEGRAIKSLNSWVHWRRGA